MLSLAMVLGFAFSCNAKEYTNFSQLVEQHKELDGKHIEVKGEAIGEPMKRGDHTWINISDGSTSIGVWLNNAQAEKVKRFGDYKEKGDIVLVKALANKSCVEHDGEIDFHGDDLSVVNGGSKIVHSLNYSRLCLGIGLSVVTVVLGIVYFKKVR